MSANQISVFLENKSGTLRRMTDVLKANNINIRAITLSETKDFGIARMIADDTYEATTVLKDAGFVSALTPVVVVKVSDKPGSLGSVLNVLSDNGINIEYMYASLNSENVKDVSFVFRVSDNKAAEAALRAAKFEIISDSETSDD